MIVIGLLFIFFMLGLGFAMVAYFANSRRRAGQNPIGTNVTDLPKHGRAISHMN